MKFERVALKPKRLPIMEAKIREVFEQAVVLVPMNDVECHVYTKE